MKTLTTLIGFLSVLCAFAQNPTVNLVIEEQSIPEPALSAIQTQIGGSPMSYRLYAEIPENYELQIVFGVNESTPLELTTAGTAFFQSPLGGPTTLDIDADLFATWPELAYDSWLTIGADQMDNNQVFVLPDPAVFAAWEAGGNLLINDAFGAGVYITTFSAIPQNTPDENGRVLIGQFTSNDDISGCLNLQLRRLNPDGTIFDPEGPGMTETVVFENECFSSAPGNPTFCASDLNSSGNVTVADVLLLLQDFGCMSDCDADVDNNGSVGTSDLLFMLSELFTICYE